MFLSLQNANATVQKPVVSERMLLTVDSIPISQEIKIGVQLRIENGWHINSHRPHEDYLIPTEVKIQQVGAVELGSANYPPASEVHLSFSETPLSVYEGSILIWFTLKIDPSFQGNRLELEASVRSQACNDVSCLAPTTEILKVSVPVVTADTKVTQTNTSIFDEAAVMGTLQGERLTAGNEIRELLAGSGLFITLFFIFAGGLALNLTPCVYPLIPITISFFTNQASGKIGRSFLLAMLYLLGMCSTYSVLGVVAAMTGGLLGSTLQHPGVLVALAAIFVIFAASMFGAFEIRVPAFLSNLAGGGRQGTVGSFVMGLTVGIVAAPCIGPFVVSLLTYVAAQGDVFMGFLMFFVLSLGLGLPFLILGTFSGMIKSLPRSGEWMIWVKKTMGIIMIGVAVFFLSPLLSELIYVVLLSITGIGGGILIGFHDKSTASFAWFRPLKVLIGVGFIAAGTWISVSSYLRANQPHIDWQPYSEALISEARASGKPVLIDFYADWCIPCKQLDKTLFAEQNIVLKSREFVALKADLTVDESELVNVLRRKYKILGVPTIIILDRSGQPWMRFTDELVGYQPEEFLNILNEVTRE